MSPVSSLLTLIQEEATRQSDEICLIASENYVSKTVMEAAGSVLTNKYAEGYPGKRYYAGNRIIDRVEELAREAAQQVFETDYHVNVQPDSGSIANLAAYTAVLEPGDTILSLSLQCGGHLTHGASVSLTGKLYNFVHYEVSSETELIDYDAVLQLAKQCKPKLIVCGATAYPALIDFSAFSRIATEVGALLLADIAHIAGLIAGKAHPSPFGLADIITTTTHKTLRGPRGGVIFCRPELTEVIDKAVFPGLQGGPHEHIIAAKAVCFIEAAQPNFRTYARQVVENAKVLAFKLQQAGFRLVADGTETHLLLLDLSTTGLLGREAQLLLESLGIICNMNLLPFDTQPARNPSGLRLGTPAVTSRGMKEKEMEILADFIIAALQNPHATSSLKDEVLSLARRFRIPAHY